MEDILKRLAESSSNESSHELQCRCFDAAEEISRLRDAIKMNKMVSVNRTAIICDSYESGYGHGLQGDGLDLSKTPHNDEEYGKAYQIGYEAGLQLFKFRQAGYANMGKVFGS